MMSSDRWSNHLIVVDCPAVFCLTVNGNVFISLHRWVVFNFCFQNKFTTSSTPFAILITNYFNLIWLNCDWNSTPNLPLTPYYSIPTPFQIQSKLRLCSLHLFPFSPIQIKTFMQLRCSLMHLYKKKVFIRTFDIL